LVVKLFLPVELDVFECQVDSECGIIKVASPKKPFSEDERKDAGMGSMFDFMKKKRVRPKKRHSSDSALVTSSNNSQPRTPPTLRVGKKSPTVAKR